MMNFGRRKEDRFPKRVRKGMYLLPSIFTVANLGAGFYAILQSMQGSINDYWRFDLAALAIGFAVFFDGLDGTIARLTNTASEFGKELDSLADAVTFGVAPAVLAWMWGFRLLPFVLDRELRGNLVQFGVICAFAFLTAGVSRLARFNIQANPQPSNPGVPGRKYFVGMPIPGGAGCIAAVVHFRLGKPIEVWWWSIAWMVFVLFCAFLMVSQWRFWSAKSIDWRSRKSFRIVLIICLLLAAIWFFSRYMLIALALLYMISGVLARLTYQFKRPTSVPPSSPQQLSEVQ